MQSIVHCISLRVVAHSDTTSIVTAWSRELGRLSMAVSVGASRRGRRHRALMSPLSLFEGVATRRGTSEMVRIGDVRPMGIGNVAALDPIKNIVALFVADFLNAVLRESQPDAQMSDFIFSSVDTLASLSGVALANFHIYFMFRLGHFLGIAPDMGSYRRERYFDMREGIFTDTPPMHPDFLAPRQTRLMYALSRLDAAHLGMLRLTRPERNLALDTIIDYYSMHHTRLSSLPSLPILRAVTENS